MAPQDTVNVPTINLSNLKPGTPLWETTKTQVFKALQEHGFFEAIYDEVPNETVEALFDTLEQVLPEGIKLNEYASKPFGRYEGEIPHFPREENTRHTVENTLHTADLLLPESVETFARTLWSNGNPDFCNVVKSYYKPLIKLDEMVKIMVLESLGLENYIDEFLDLSNLYCLRLTQYYNATHEGEDENKEGSGAHKDASFLTIIKQKHVGLQVLTKKGEWIELNVTPNSYFVLASDSLVAWTNNRLPSATHRVIIKRNNRSSVQLFSSAKPGYTVNAPKELVDEEHPLHFKPFDIAEYYKYVTLKAKFTDLQDYLKV